MRVLLDLQSAPVKRITVQRPHCIPPVFPRLSCFSRRLRSLMDVTREDRLRQLEEEVQSSRAAVLRHAPPAVDAFAVAELPMDGQSQDVRFEKLGNSLYKLWDFSGDAAALEDAIAAYEEALVKLRPSGHNRRATALDDLGEALGRFCGFVNQDRARLERSILLHREALQLHQPGHPARDASLYNLANSLNTQFRQEGSLATLDEAIASHREALQLRPPGHPHRDASLNGLANCLRYRCEQQGELEMLDEAIDLHREALQLRSPGHPDRLKSLNNLAGALQIRFDQHGGLETLDEAITLHRESVQLAAPGHPNRNVALINLANTLAIRFEQQGGSETLDKAIELHREALQLCPPGHPIRDASLGNLANSLSTRFKHQGDLETLDEAIALHRESLRLCPPGHPYRDSPLEYLATMLLNRFKQQGGLETLDEAITLSREALQLRPPGHPTRSEGLNDLAIMLLTRFTQRGGLETLDEAIALNHEALQLRPSGHYNRYRSLFALARCFLISGSERFDFTTASSHISEALVDNAAHIRGRLIGARDDLPAIDSAYATIVNHADLATRTEYGEIVLRLYYQAIQLLPRAANFGLDSSTRLQAITGSDQLSRDGAAHAIILNRLREAVEILEEGRGVFWFQTLHLCAASLDNVPEIDRLELEKVFEVLQSDNSMIGFANRPVEDRERALAARRMLNEKAEALISKIRTYPGLDRFLLPPAFDSLMASLPSGFVVVLNFSRLGCHALLLNGATGLAKSLVVAATSSGFDLKMIRTRLPRDMGSGTMDVKGDGGNRAMKAVDGKVTTFENTLQSMWVSLVRPVIIGLGLEVCAPAFSS
jgi:hypothetical protein